MFRLRRPDPDEIEPAVARAAWLPLGRAEFLAARAGLRGGRLPLLFAHDRSSSLLGRGAGCFAAARQAFERWTMFDLGWARVANEETRIGVGQAVAVEVKSLGLWTLNVSRIVETIDEPGCFGFIYQTTAEHVERGEERFLLEMAPSSNEVRYVLEAVSQPRDVFAALGLPVTRAFQRRFARDSHARMGGERGG